MQLSIDRNALESLLAHAASAAHLVGHLDSPIAAGPLAEHIDAIVHALTELLGNPHAHADPDCSAPRDRLVRTGRLMLTPGSRGAL
jgi:hypothetical protein